MTRTFVDIHVLQTVPPSNLNRDDTGSPKTAYYGGARRARVSSQAWKRATRKEFQHVLDARDLGLRTKRVVEAVAERIAAQAPDLAEQALELANQTIKAAGIETKEPRKKKGEETAGTPEPGYLVFFSARQLENLAGAAVTAARGDDPADKALKQIDVKRLANRDHSIDMSLFGRMVADEPNINVDAAAQVAHAISVHPVETEFDYYTAVDDTKEQEDETGAGMIGTVEFNAATLYRYATVDVDRLHDNLGDADATRRAVEAFTRAFVTSMPTGKQNTFANRTLPDAVLVRVRDSQPVSFAAAYEEPVHDNGTIGRVQAAAKRLAAYAEEIDRAYGQPQRHAWVVRVGDRTAPLADLGEDTTLDRLVTALGETVHLQHDVTVT